MVTIIVSVSPTMPEVLHHNLYRLLSRETRHLMEDGGHDTVTVVETLPAGIPPKSPHKVRSKILQGHRQKIVDMYVKGKTEEDFVIFVDADLINMTEGLLNSLVDTCIRARPCSVVAPAVLLESHGGVGLQRWYDTAGFIHDGCRTQLYPPWFSLEAYKNSGVQLSPPPFFTVQPGTIVELNGSVGCIYCVHGPVFRGLGFQGEFDSATFTEHYCLCQNARLMGGQLLVRLDLEARHAYLPKYGEDFH